MRINECAPGHTLRAPPLTPAELNQQFGSFLAGAELFDPAALGVSPAEALLMDPQQRLVMQGFSGGPRCAASRSLPAFQALGCPV